MNENRTTVRAGDLTADLVEGELRYIRVGGVEVVRRLSYAIRDRVWDTIIGTEVTIEVDESEDGFVVRRTARHRSHDMDVVCEFTVTARPGVMTAEFRAVPTTDFEFARIGIVVLHPAALAGVPLEIDTVAGTMNTSFPVDVEPQWQRGDEVVGMFRPFSTLRIRSGELAVEHRFEGDLFEMEDQRNWFDGSYKTYSTPLESGWPRPAKEADEIRQSVETRVVGSAPSRPSRRTVSVGAAPIGVMPKVGVTMSDLKGVEGALASIAPDHVRVEVQLGDDASSAIAAFAAAVAAGVPVELVVIGDVGASLEELPDPIASSAVSISRVVAVERGEPIASTNWVRQLESVFPTLPVVGASDGYFADVNRRRPVLHAPAGLGFPLTCQVHQTDDDTIFEGLAAIEPVVRSARRLSGGSGIVISPVTLLPRFNPFADPDADPEVTADERHGTPIAAAWTLGCLAGLAQGGAASATLFDVRGASGLVDDDGQLRPEGVVITSVTEAAHQSPRLFGVSVDEPRFVAALALGDEVAEVLFLANLTDCPQTVDAEPFGSGIILAPYEVRTLRCGNSCPPSR